MEEPIIIPVEATKDYSLFNYILGNREINPNKVEFMEKEILNLNLLHLHPIVVDNFYNIVDGQHRLEVAKKNNLYIYYLRSRTPLPNDSMVSINKISSNWTIQDFVNYYAKIGNEHYIKFIEYVNSQKISYSIGMVIFGYKKLHLSKILRNQEFVFCEAKAQKGRETIAAYRNLLSQIIIKGEKVTLKIFASNQFLQALCEYETTNVFQTVEKIFKLRTLFYHQSGYIQHLKQLEAILSNDP